MISIRKLNKRFGDKVIFDHFDLTLETPGLYALTGPSGRGKTTLLRILAGLDRDYDGVVETDISGGSPAVSMVFQEDRLLPNLTVLENVALVCRNEQTAYRQLKLVGLDTEAQTKPAALSGGMRRRVAIARALAYPHDLLLLDEPFASLDDEIKAKIMTAVMRLATEKTVIIVTHNPAEIEYMHAREIRLDGQTEDPSGT